MSKEKEFSVRFTEKELKEIRTLATIQFEHELGSRISQNRSVEEACEAESNIDWAVILKISNVLDKHKK